jgi:hypothetical protein
VEPIPKKLEHLLEKRATVGRRKVKDRRSAANQQTPKVERRVSKRRKAPSRRKP